MNDKKIYDALIVVTDSDFERLIPSQKRIIDNLPSQRILFVGNDRVVQLANELYGDNERVGAINENDIIPFDGVHKLMTDIMSDFLDGHALPRGITGWYYQQFLKMQYAYISENQYYMTWDGDTVPCKSFSMFSDETGQPYFDVKEEYHAEYFRTMNRIIPDMKKVIRSSFISEHMLFDKDVMIKLINTIDANTELIGSIWWEKILRSIAPGNIQNSAFSEFETYGTFVALTNPSMYRIREWHSFRLGAQFFNQLSICDRDYEWLSKDFQAISFEKNQSVRSDHKNLFDNPEYQSKLTAKQMLQIAQEEFEDGYREIWEGPGSELTGMENTY